jgi:hypothetical protein
MKAKGTVKSMKTPVKLAREDAIAKIRQHLGHNHFVITDECTDPGDYFTNGDVIWWQSEFEWEETPSVS